ncbi:MAG: hypothetical protein IK144_08675 [Bacteroidaceae bacterium]|nr:hypothetical protein [Bacteroidaceae bacterium]
MKKFYMTMAAMLCGVAAMAQIGTLSCEDVTVADNETPYVVVLLNTEDATAISGINFTMVLPDGVSIAKVYNEDDEEWVDDVTFPIAKAKHQSGVMTATEGYLVYVAAETSVSFKTTTNEVVKIGLDVANLAKGTYDIKFKSIGLSDKGSPIKSYEQDDFTAQLINGGDGIYEIKALDNNAPVYNLAGQRVSKAQKGVYVQSGKKVAVK